MSSNACLVGDIIFSFSFLFLILFALSRKRTAFELFTAGKKAEVAFDDEDPHEVWFPATVLKHFHRNTFQVEYQQPGSGDEAVLHKAIVDFWHIRPSPPHLRDKDFGLDDEVDAYYDFGWWCGVITKELPDNRYSVFFEHSNKEREFICSKLRPHLKWVHFSCKWYNKGDTIFQVFISLHLSLTGLLELYCNNPTLFLSFLFIRYRA